MIFILPSSRMANDDPIIRSYPPSPDNISTKVASQMACSNEWKLAKIGERKSGGGRKQFMGIRETFSFSPPFQPLKSGTTAVCSLIRGNTFYSAWLGDSQAILVRRGRPVRIVDPHKPNRPVWTIFFDRFLSVSLIQYPKYSGREGAYREPRWFRHLLGNLEGQRTARGFQSHR